LITYESGGSKTAIDYILVGKEEKVRSVKAIPGEEVMMQHCFVVMDIYYRKIQNVQAVANKQVKLWRLKHENVQKALEEKMERVITEDDDWDVIIQKMAKTMKKVCGIFRDGSEKETWWWNGDVEKGLR